MKGFRRFTHNATGGFMMIWLSGVVFLFCCEMPGGRAEAEEFCPLKRVSEHCDKAEELSKIGFAIDRSKEPMADCCAFIPAVFDKARKIDKSQLLAAPAAERVISRPIRSGTFSISNPTYSAPNFVLIRSGTYLKNRTLRI